MFVHDGEKKEDRLVNFPVLANDEEGRVQFTCTL